MAILEVKNVGKRFGGLQALSDVNLSVAENSVHAIIGPNGAGKSTLLNCLVGKLIPDTGSVMFDGQSVLGRKPYEINQMGISRVFQTPEIFGDLTVFENMMIPLFAKRDGAYRLHAIESVMNEKSLIEEAEKIAGVTVFHAGTTRADGELKTSGGRVLNVVATGENFAQARARAYEALLRITLEGGQFRTDIAARVS